MCPKKGTSSVAETSVAILDQEDAGDLGRYSVALRRSLQATIDFAVFEKD